MPDVPRPQLALYALAALAVVLVGARYLRETSGAPQPVPAATTAAARTGTAGGAGVQVHASGGGAVIVHVVGAVRRPGVYRMRAGQRVDDAVHRAGGATAAADLAGVNLAAKVQDGRQIIVPARAVAAAGAAVAAGGAVPAAGASDATTASGGTAAGTAGGLGAVPAPPLNLNTATAEQLETLDGVGPVTAAKILAYRQQHGGFGSVDELAQVPGIGPKRLAALRERVRV